MYHHSVFTKDLRIFLMRQIGKVNDLVNIQILTLVQNLIFIFQYWQGCIFLEREGKGA